MLYRTNVHVHVHVSWLNHSCGCFLRQRMLEITRLNPCEYTHVHVADSLQAMYNVGKQSVIHVYIVHVCVRVSPCSLSCVHVCVRVSPCSLSCVHVHVCSCLSLQSQLCTVVRNVRQAHECLESGESQQFFDEMDYLMDSIQQTQPLAVRCLG